MPKRYIAKNPLKFKVKMKTSELHRSGVAEGRVMTAASMMVIIFAFVTNVYAVQSESISKPKKTETDCTKNWCAEPENYTYAIVGNDKLKLDVSFNDPLNLELPEGEKILGKGIQVTVDIVKLEKLGGRLYSVIPIVPKAVKNKASWILGQKTSLRINFQSGRSLNLYLRMGRKGVTRLELTSPKMAEKIAWREKVLREERKKLQLEFEERKEELDSEANRLALRILAKQSTKRIQCREIEERERTDLLEGVATSLCMIGDYLLLNFTILNRRRSLAVFNENSVNIYIKEGKELNKLDAILVWESDRPPQLRYDRTGKGAIILPVSDDTIGKEFYLKISEEKGRQREVLIDGIEF